MAKRGQKTLENIVMNEILSQERGNSSDQIKMIDTTSGAGDKPFLGFMNDRASQNLDILDKNLRDADAHMSDDSLSELLIDDQSK